MRPLLWVTLLAVGSAAIVMTIVRASTPHGIQPSLIPALIAAAFSAALVFVYVSWKRKRWFSLITLVVNGCGVGRCGTVLVA